MKRVSPWFLLLGVLLATYVHNLRLYPWLRGYDAFGRWLHLQQTAARGGWPPLPQQGWEDYGMPLYYTLSSRLQALLHLDLVATARGLNLVAALLAAAAMGWMARRQGLRTPWAAALLLLSTPVLMRLAPMVHSGALALALLTVFYALLVDAWRDPVLRLWREVALGVVAGLAMLSRPEAAIALPLLLCLALCRRRWQQQPWGPVLVAASLSLLLAVAVVAPFELRNLACYDRLTVVTNDADMFPLGLANPSDTLPFTHSLTFFLWPGAPDVHASPQALWGPVFADAWWDSLGFFFSTPRLVVWLGLTGALLTLLTTLGLWRALGDVRQYWPHLAGLACSLAIFVLAEARIPVWVNVKACYLLGLFAPAALLAVVGKEWLQDKAGAQARWIDVGLGGLVFFLAVAHWL